MADKVLRCRPPATLRFGSFPRLLETLPNQSSGCGLNIDLEELRWIEALPLAILAALSKDHTRRNLTEKNSISYGPKHDYLRRMDFFETVGAKLPPEKFKRHDPRGRFVPVRQVLRGADVPTAAEEVVQTLRVDDADAARILRHCVGEILDNVFVHARSPVDAVICAQHFPNAERSQVAIVDTGMGFKESFSASPPFDSMRLTDREALVLGLAPFVTSKPQTNSPYEQGYGRLGVGLFIASDILDQIGGRILVVSGNEAVDRRHGRTRWRRVRHWRGSIVGFEVPDVPDVSYAEATARARKRARELESARNAQLTLPGARR